MLLRLLPTPAGLPAGLTTDPAADLRGLHQLRPDRPWLYGLRPGADRPATPDPRVRYRINADGFRDRPHARPKAAGTFRIVVLGDSVAFGVGVNADETFPQQLEALLAARAGPTPIEVVNLAVPGYNPYTEAKLFADLGVGYEPDLVLVEFCPNDLDNPTLHFGASSPLPLLALPDDAYPDPGQRRPPPTAAGPCDALRLCALVLRTIGRGPGLSQEDIKTLLTVGDARPSELAWLRARYDEIAQVAAAHDARFGVVVFPRTTAIAPGTSPFQARLLALARDAGWPAIDLLPALHRALQEERTPLFPPRDPWHPTARGHRVVAEAILAELVRLQLVPVAAAELPRS